MFATSRTSGAAAAMPWRGSTSARAAAVCAASRPRASNAGPGPGRSSLGSVEPKGGFRRLEIGVDAVAYLAVRLEARRATRGARDGERRRPVGHGPE